MPRLYHTNITTRKNSECSALGTNPVNGTANARAAAASDRAIIEARLQIEEADDLLAKIAATRRRLGEGGVMRPSATGKRAGA